MSKAEERGKTYALHKASEKSHAYYGNAMLSVVQFDGYDIKNAYAEGYHQAEKDLKGSLVAEIEERYNECRKRAKIIDSDYWNGNADAYRNVLAILNDTFEVKECEEEPYVTKKLGSYTTTTKIIKKGEKV